MIIANKLMNFEDDGNIHFSVNQQDLEEALDPISAGVKKRKKQTHEQQIYGIWANSSGSEEESNFSNERPHGKRNKDYTAPVSFVNSNTGSGEDKVRNVSRKEGHGYARNPPSIRSSHIGTWEKYTKGFGSKMLEKMGYKEGQGLGRDGSGIVEPIKVQGKKNRVCLDSTQPQHPEPMFTENLPEPESRQEKIRKSDRWKKTRNEARASDRESRFKSVNEVMESVKHPRKLNKPKPQSFLFSDRSEQKTKVINMTGPEYQEFDSLEEYVQKSGHRRREVDFLPELVQNLDLLVENAENSIVKLDRQMDYDSDMLVQLKHERTELEMKQSNSSQKLSHISKLLRTLEMIEQRSLSGIIDLEMCEQWFRDLLADFPVEYTQMRVCLLARPIVFPLIQKEISAWDPIRSPSDEKVCALFETWRELLEVEPVPSPGLTVYEQLLLDVWLAKFASHLSDQSLRQPLPLIQLLEAWRDHFTPLILSQIERHHVLPALKREIADWDPTQDVQPLHYWVQPWLSIIQHGLDAIYPDIRRKLSAALMQWHPSDPSAYRVIKPWMGVFSQGEFAAFLATAILPKLSVALQHLVVDPSDQKLEPFSDTMRWRDLLTTSQLSDVLCHQFFPKWLCVLDSWLSATPDFHEVSRWYLGWKEKFDTELLSYPPVQQNFLRALDMMNSAAQWNPNHSLRDDISRFTLQERQSSFPHSIPPQTRTLPTHTTAPELSFREMLQKYAQRDDTIYIPLNKQGPKGNYLYKFGLRTIFIEKNVIFAAKDNSWLPISIDDLLASCN